MAPKIRNRCRTPTGLHEEQGRITISDYILHMVSHDTIHAAQIARQLQQVIV